MKKLVFLLVAFVLVFGCKQGNRSGFYLLRSCNKASQITEKADTSSFFNRVKLLELKKLPDTLKTEYYQALLLVPDNSAEWHAIAVYQLPKLIGARLTNDFYAKILVTTDSLDTLHYKSNNYCFIYNHLKNNYSIKK